MERKNVILITADSVRADYCGFLNDARDTTPFLSDVAGESIVFTNAIAPGPRTLSSVPVSHTGEHFPLSDIDGYDSRVSRVRKHVQANETLPEMFGRKGYATVGFCTNPWTSTKSGFGKGFDDFREFVDSREGRIQDPFKNTPLEMPAIFLDQWYYDKVWFSSWRKYYDTYVNVIGDLPEPYFVWIFLLDTHNPYIPPKQDRRESSTAGIYWNLLRANSLFDHTEAESMFRSDIGERTAEALKRAYRDCIRSVDRFVESLHEDLDDDSTVIAIHSDHGEGLGDHGTFGHRPDLYRENLHVPLILTGVDHHERVKRLVSLKSLPELLLQAAADGGHDAETLAEQGREYVFSKVEDDSKISVRSDEWKLITAPDGDELYRIADDPRETENMVDEYESVYRELASRIDEFRSNLPRMVVEQQEGVSDDLMDRLNSLGYVD